jgi:hypothetical protein
MTLIKNKARKMPDLKLEAGESSRARGRKKERDVCSWLYVNGVSTAEIINSVSGQKAPGFAKKMVNKGLLAASKTVSGSPTFFYTLTKSGLDLAMSIAAQPVHYKCMEPHKLSQTIFSHNFCVQKISLEARERYGFSFQSQAQIAVKHSSGVKVPDAVWLDKNGDRIAVEVEFSQKFGRVLDQTIVSIVNSLEKSEYRCYFFFVRSPVIAENYARAMAPGTVYDVWEKNQRGGWMYLEANRKAVPHWLIDRVFFLDANLPFEDPRPLAFDL